MSQESIPGLFQNIVNSYNQHDSIQSEAMYVARKFLKPHVNKRTYQSAEDYFFKNIAFGMSECFFWLGPRDHAGYGVSCFKKKQKAHRFAYKIFKGPIIKNVLHTCDVRSCVNPDHLYEGDQKQNMRDCNERGRMVRGRCEGDMNGSAKLTAELVLEMRSLRELSGLSYLKIGKKFGCSPMTAMRAIKKESWRSV